MPKIYVKFNTAVIGQFDINKDIISFGRKEGNDIRIDHPAVSGSHGRIIKEGEDYFVEDLNSTNGTFLNGRKVSKAKLSNKDNIHVAKHILEFLSVVDAASAPSGVADLQAKPAASATPVIKIPVPKTSLQEAIQDLMKEEPEKKTEVPVAVLKIISGSVLNQTEVRLTELVTYIGTSDQALIKIKGILAPSLAAAISKRTDGYFLKAVKPGYPKVNGKPIQEQVLLENGSLIECGATNMAFYFNTGKKDK